MFNADNINESFYQEYDKLINLLKKKGATPEKYSELRNILSYFAKKEKFNSDELKILKNVLIITEDILNRAIPNRKMQKEQKEECTQLYILIKNKNLQK